MAILHYQNGVLVPFASKAEGDTIFRQNNNPSLNEFIIHRADSKLDSKIWTEDLVSSSYVFYRPNANPSFIRGLEFGNPILDADSDEDEINLSQEVLDSFSSRYPQNLPVIGDVIDVRDFGRSVNSIFGVKESAGEEYGRKLGTLGVRTVKVYMIHERFLSRPILRQVRLKGASLDNKNPGGILCDGRPYFKKKSSLLKSPQAYKQTIL